MRRVVRENALSVLMASVGCATVAWLALSGFAWNDYENEALPAVAALTRGHFVEFLRLAPAYGGSLLERAPFALLPGSWGGGELAVYRMLALPCLLATAALGLWLLARMRSEGRPALARALALTVCVANPITLRALEVGHPEELLGGSLCVAAVLLAARTSISRRRALSVGVLLGLAIANKQWALLAAGPILLALPSGRRLACAFGAGATAAALLGPFAIASSGALLTSTRAIASPGATIFQPWQIWWFLGHHGPLVHGLFGAAKPGYRVGPAWTGVVSHPLVVAAGLVITAALWLRSHRREPGFVALRPVLGEVTSSASPIRDRSSGRLPERSALLALALVLLLRCLLDTWDTVYYTLPFILALLAWELTGPIRRLPILALGSSVLVWISFQWLPGLVSADAQAAVFLAWSLPLAAMLALRLLSTTEPALGGQAAPERQTRAQEITVSSLGSFVRIS
jgi:hypothetical protein